MNKCNQNLKLYKCPFNDLGLSPVSVFHDGKLHIMGGDENCYHITFDPVTTEWLKDYKFMEIEGAALIHVESKNVLYLIGGYVQGQYESSDKI